MLTLPQDVSLAAWLTSYQDLFVGRLYKARTGKLASGISLCEEASQWGVVQQGPLKPSSKPDKGLLCPLGAERSNPIL